MIGYAARRVSRFPITDDHPGGAQAYPNRINQLGPHVQFYQQGRNETMRIVNPVTVEVTETRWTTTIRMTDTAGQEHEYRYTLPWRSHEGHRRARLDQMVAAS